MKIITKDNCLYDENNTFLGVATLHQAKTYGKKRLYYAFAHKATISNEKNLEHKLLRPHQIQDLIFLKRLKKNYKQGAGIFNEMRTGKTPLILTFLQEETDLKTVMILTPPNLVLNWEKEIKTWAQRFKVFNLNQKKPLRDNLLEEYINYQGDKIMLIGTSMLVKDKIKQKGDALIIDEGHFLTKKSARSKQIKNIAKRYEYVYILTGTPTSKNASEIFDLANIIRPNRQKLDVMKWKNYFCNSVYNHFAYSGKMFTTIKKDKEKEFQVWLKSNFTRKKFINPKEKSPFKVETEFVSLQPSAIQTRAQNHINNFMELENGDLIPNTLVKLVRLKQLYTAPLLLNYKEVGPKIEWLTNYLNKNRNKPIIIFSTFSSLLFKLEKYFKKNNLKTGLITGKETNKQKLDNVKDFQEGRINILFCNITSGSKGWTLDRGEVIIFLDISYAWEENDQAKARFWPTQGQTHPLKIYYLFIKGSIERQVWQLVSKKISKTEIINKFKN